MRRTRGWICPVSANAGPGPAGRQRQACLDGEPHVGDRRHERTVQFLGPLPQRNVWTIQGLWVTFTAAAAWVGITSSQRVAFDWLAVVGLVLWAVGFAFEVVADLQKSRFKADPANEGRFINTGLWSKSRHPNYFGEIVLWIGVALIALPTFQGWQWIAIISPLFVTLLLTRVSGVPMLEKKADGKWGGQADYEEYKRTTPVLIPRP